MPHKLLLADDSVTIQRVIELTFADEDIEVIAVGDGERAVQRIREDRPDIVLADVDMPYRDGFAVASFVKADPELSHIKVILLTGAFEPVDEARVRAAGCDGVLAKPFEPQLLIARVRELLTGSEARPKTAAAAPSVASAAPMAKPPAKEAGETGTVRASGAVLRSEEAEPKPVSLDEYFDQLDVAFASRGFTLEDDRAPAPRPAPGEFAGSAGVDRAPGGVHQGSGLVPAVAPPLDVTFSALLAAEQTAGGTSGLQAGGEPPRIPFFSVNAIVDEVTRRVVQRMADRGVREQVADIVSRIADRLVREEIERVKASIK